jgi:cell division protease FtsH
MQQVDAEIRRIIDDQYGLARKLIEDNSAKVEAMAKALMEWETIDADQVGDIMEGRPPRPSQAASQYSGSPAVARQCHGTSDSNTRPRSVTTAKRGQWG